VSQVIRIVNDDNDEVTAQVVIDGASTMESSPSTIIDASSLKNAIPGFSDFRLTFKSVSWSVSKNVTICFLDTTVADSEVILILPESTSGNFNLKIENNSPSPDGGDISYHTDNGNTYGYFLITFIKETGYGFTGKRYRKVGQPNPYLTNS
jgi:hypothetical protein